MRKLPKLNERVETGSVQFGDDWPGIFIRGDDAMGLAQRLYALRDPIIRNHAELFERGALVELIDFLQSCYDRHPAATD